MKIKWTLYCWTLIGILSCSYNDKSNINGNLFVATKKAKICARVLVRWDNCDSSVLLSILKLISIVSILKIYEEVHPLIAQRMIMKFLLIGIVLATIILKRWVRLIGPVLARGRENRFALSQTCVYHWYEIFWKGAREKNKDYQHKLGAKITNENFKAISNLEKPWFSSWRENSYCISILLPAVG